MSSKLYGHRAVEVDRAAAGNVTAMVDRRQNANTISTLDFGS